MGTAGSWLAGVPRAWRLRFVPDTDALNADADRQGADAHSRDETVLPFAGSIERSLDGAALPDHARRRPVDVVLPAEAGLTRRHTIPRAARGRIESILALDLRRSTMLEPSDVVWCHRITDDRVDELFVAQTILRRRDLQRISGWAAEQGARIGRVLVNTDAGLQEIDAGQKTRRQWSGPWPRVNIALGAGLIAALLILFGYPHLQRSEALASLQTENGDLRARGVTQRQALEEKRARVEKQTALSAHLVRTLQKSNILRELTVRLPDEAWLADLEIRDGTMRFSGFIRGSAAELTIGLAQSPMFDNPRLVGPVAIAPGTQAERFEILVDLPVRP